MNEISVEPRPWKRALLWLLFLGPFFFISYGSVNGYASQLSDVGSIVFDWEQYIPFIAWSIIPYWMIDVFYGVSLFVCRNKIELDTHAKRLVTAQLIAVTCFFLFPLTFSFERPETSGVSGVLFDTLTSFDKPFNQAPSLHITLLVILWVIYYRQVPKSLIWPVHVMAIVIGISVLTTFQHHFIDVPTGALLGWLCIWLWPDDGNFPLVKATRNYQQRRLRLAGYYAFAASLLAIIAIYLRGTTLWLLWPSVSLFFVSSFYLYVGAKGFQKSPNGNISIASRWLIYPYFVGAWVNSRLWTRHDNKADKILDNVYLGRFPSRQDIQNGKYKTVIDLSAELSAPFNTISWCAFPTLDLLTPDKKLLIEAAKAIESSNNAGPVLVCCALGYSRSSLAIIYWLILFGRANTSAEAISIVTQSRPRLVLKDTDHLLIESIVKDNREN